MDDAEEARTIGRRLREVRFARRKSLAVIAGRAGISPSYLSRLESGERALDRRSLIMALANALEIAPSELTRLPVPAPDNGDVDVAVEGVRRALMAASRNRPGGQVVSVDELQARVDALHPQGYERDLKQVGTALPGLIRDLHATLAAGRDVAELLDLAVLFHAQDTRGWLWMQRAPLDLRWQAAALAQQVAQQRDTPIAIGVATWGAAIEMIGGGAFDLAETELDAVTVPTNLPEGMQLAGMLALSRSLVAASAGRPGDVAAPLEFASDLAERTGEGDAYWMGFGPINVGIWRMAAALEAGDHEQTAAIAEGLRPEGHRSRERQATYWVDYGRALARLRGRQEDAVRALRRAERLHPTRVHRSQFARETIAELLARARRDAQGRELRGMAYRAGLPV